MRAILRPASALVCAVLSACAAGGPSASPNPAGSVTTAMPTVSASTTTPVPTATSASATPQATPAPAPALLPPGAVVRTTVSGLRLRADASSDAEVIATLRQGEQLVVIDNPSQLSPISADGREWYWVAWNPNGVPWPFSVADSMADGFVAAGQDGAAYLELVPVACSNEAPTPTSIALMTPYARSVCFGGRTLTIHGTSSSGFGGLPVPGTYEPAWLAHPFASLGAISDGEAGIIYHYPPGLALPAFDADGTPLLVMGHFNDPASATCVIEPDGPHSSHPETAQSYCEEQFVATQVSLAEP